MKDPARLVRNVTIAGFAIVLVACLAMAFRHRAELLGGFALRGAQSRFEERVRRALGPATGIEYGESGQHAARLEIEVPPEVGADASSSAAALDDVWVAYAELFAAGGMPVDGVVLTTGAGTVESAAASVHALAARTGVPAPPLHPMYAGKGYFDPSAVPAPSGPGGDAVTDD